MPVNPACSFAVLVADDDPDTRGVTKTVFEGEAHQVLLAAGGAEAIAVFEAEQPDRVLLDVRMPESSAASRGDATEFRVVDAGTGVPLELREKIFNPFVQVEGSGQDGSFSRSGRGLGLAFCKLAIEAHGGRIWVGEAAPGAVFCVSLPTGA